MAAAMSIFLALLALLISAVLLADRLGVLRLPRKELKHEHIWDVWEECTVSDWEYVRGEKVRVSSPAQSRDCLSCGEREARRVTA